MGILDRLFGREKVKNETPINESSKAIEPHIQALKDDDWKVRVRAIEALRKDANAIKPLIDLLKDKSVFVSLRAAEALDELGWKPPFDKKRDYLIAKCPTMVGGETFISSY